MFSLLLPGYLCHMLDIKSHTSDDDCQYSISSLLKKRGEKKTFPFFFLLANYLQKAQHCLNNKKAFTDGHKSICSESILMNIYSPQLF